MRKALRNIEFTKMHGTGNDFILVEKKNIPQDVDLSTFALLACSRHFGIGSDGLLILSPHTEADFEMIMYNPDGSLAEMCGNGIRCIGKYIYEHGLSKKEKLRIMTGAGVIPLLLEIDNENLVKWIEVSMGYPDFIRKNIPVSGDGETALAEQISLGSGLDLELHAVSIGNPHAVLFVDNVDSYPVHEIGPIIENHPLFPNRINVEFVEHKSPEWIKVRIWERGAGETLSCGTGVCASASVCRKLGLVAASVKVDIPGGQLIIRFDDEGAIYLGGPAEEVFKGVIM